MELSGNGSNFIILISIVIVLMGKPPILIVGAAMSRNPQSLRLWVIEEAKFLQDFKIAMKDEASGIITDQDEEMERRFENYMTDYRENFLLTPGLDDVPLADKLIAVTTNPLVAFRMIWRMVHLLPNLSNWTKLKNESIKEFQDSGNKPALEDFEDVTIGILRLHHVYDLNITQFAQGHILDSGVGPKLNGIHCYEIGLKAFTKKYYSLAIEWFELAQLKIKLELDLTVSNFVVQEALDFAMKEHDENFDSKYELNPYFFEFSIPHYQKNQENGTEKIIRRKLRSVFVESFKGKQDPQFDDVNFWDLCSNGSFQSQEEKSQLFCWLDTKTHFTWRIRPLKIEMLARNPDIIQIYDLLRPKIVEQLKKVTESNLKMSLIANKNVPGGLTYSSGRTSMSTFINERTDPLLAPIPKLIEMVTGLQVEKFSSSEMLQVASYTFSGHYEVHKDALTNPDVDSAIKGNRIATFMFYLDDVEMGGKTVFTQTGAVVGIKTFLNLIQLNHSLATPVKGSAVFWYNLHRNGEIDWSTLHGACPVLLGHKWIANKWIRMNDQMFTHPCTSSLKLSKQKFKTLSWIQN